MAKMIKPMIFLKPNQCPKCLSSMELIEEEINVSNMTTDGVPIMNNETYINITLKCKKCKTTYPATKDGIHFSIKPSQSNEKPKIIMNDYNPFYI